MGYEVVYGDTDSLMVLTEIELERESWDREIGELVGRVEREINKQYAFIRIECEKVFTRLIILSKKKYIAWDRSQ